MAFKNIRFPTAISYGASGGPGFNTQIVSLPSSAEERVSKWSGARRFFNVRYGVKTPEQMATLLAFFNVVQGATYSFRYKDWTDFASTSDGMTSADPRVGGSTTGGMGAAMPTSSDQALGIGDGSTTTFQLRKTYTYSGETLLRNVILPISGTILIENDGVLQTETTDYTIDYESGVVTFATAPAINDVLKWGGEFDCHCRFDEQTDRQLQVRIESFKTLTSDGITIRELPDSAPLPPSIPVRGAEAHDPMSADVFLTMFSGGYQRLNPDAAGRNIFLPSINNIGSGVDYFTIHNIDGTNTVEVFSYTGSSIAVIATNSVVRLHLAETSTGAKYWVAT